MDIEKKYKWTLTGFIIMVILNVGILTTLWFNASSNRPYQRGGHEQGNMHAYFQKKLSLSGAQSDTISTLRKIHFREIKQLQRELNQKRSNYLNFVLGDESTNMELRDSLLADLTLQFAEIESRMYVHMQEMREVLSEDQQRIFKDMMNRDFSKGHNKGHR